jgi:predicted nucleic acid-binding protein
VLVVDTSAVLEALIARDPSPGLIERLASDGDLHGPHLIDTEVLHALRRMTHRNEISEERAYDARGDFAELGLVRYPHQPFNDRVWEMRHNLSAYDATFVALAEALAAPLITCDARLASAPGHEAQIELFDASAEHAPIGGATSGYPPVQLGGNP